MWEGYTFCQKGVNRSYKFHPFLFFHDREMIIMSDNRRRHGWPDTSMSFDFCFQISQSRTFYKRNAKKASLLYRYKRFFTSSHIPSSMRLVTFTSSIRYFSLELFINIEERSDNLTFTSNLTIGEFSCSPPQGGYIGRYLYLLYPILDQEWRAFS